MSTGGDGEKLGSIYVEVDARMVGLEAKLDRAKKESQSCERALANLKDMVARGVISETQFAQATENVRARLAQTKTEMNALAAELAKANTQMERSATATARSGASADRAAASKGKLARSAGEAGRESGKAGHRLMQLGQTLDDLQYVGEMGLRPIVNNLMQISPAVGIALLAFTQLQKHGKELEEIFQGVWEYWTEGASKSEGAAARMEAAVGQIAGALQNASRFLADFGEGWDALGGGPQRRREATNKQFLGVGTDEARERGQAMAEAIDAYGRQQFVREAIAKRSQFDPELRNPMNPRHQEAVADETSRLAELFRGLGHGDENAIAAILARTEGTQVGGKIRENLPEVRKAREEQERALDEEIALDQAESERRLAKRKAENERRAREQESRAGVLAGDLYGRLRDATVTGQGVDEGRVRQELAAQGLKGAEADKIAPLVLKSLNERFTEEVRRQSAESGRSPHEVLGEMRQEAEQRPVEEARRRQAEQDQKDRAAAEKAREVLPALDDQVRKNLVGAGLSGASRSSIETGVARQLESALKAQGLSPEEAARAARELVGKGMRGLDDEIMRRSLEEEHRPARAPEALGAMAMLQRVQSGVMERDIGRDQLDQLVAQSKLQTQMVELMREQGRNPRRAVLGP